MATKIVMPEMGEGVVEGTVVQWLKHEGDAVQVDEPVLEIETDKVTVEVNAEAEGVLLKINVDEGQTVAAGTVLAVIGAEGESVGETAEPAQRPAQAEISQPPATPEPEMPVAQAPATPAPKVPAPSASPANGTENHTSDNAPAFTGDSEGVRVSPVVARMIQEHNIDISRVRGTGLHGRVTKNDVLAYLENPPVEQTRHVPTPSRTIQSTDAPVQAETTSTPATPASVTVPAPKPDSEGEIMPLSAMRRGIANHMVNSVKTSPHATTFFEFDFTAVAHHRKQHKAEFAAQGVKLTYMPYIIMATVEALRKHPMVNGQWTDEGVLLKPEIHLGMAVAIDEGLIVPVIRNADTLNMLGLARAVNDYAERARTNKLKPDEVRGGTFTISNHGASGSLAGTPIINQPQVGILGFGMIEKRVKVVTDTFGADTLSIRPMAYVSFSFDHRILDGATADAFVMDIKHRLENWSD